MKLFFTLLILAMTTVGFAQTNSARWNLIMLLENEPHVTGVFLSVCAKDGTLANAFTYPRVYCNTIDTDDLETELKLKAKFPVGSYFDGMLVLVMDFQAPKQLGPTIVDDSGKRMDVDLNTAKSYCMRQGGALATMRQYALFAATHGARGIRESAFKFVSIDDPRVIQEEKEMFKDGQFKAVHRFNGYGEESADFYFSGLGLKPFPDAGMEYGTFWSSTVQADGTPYVMYFGAWTPNGPLQADVRRSENSLYGFKCFGNQVFGKIIE